VSLRAQMAIDACAILNNEELGERAIWTRAATSATLPRSVRLIEQPDRQTVRRAHIWTPIDTTTVSVGDLFSVKRGQVTTVWRVMYSDPAETAIQRSYCHLQLSEALTFRRTQYVLQRRGVKDAGIPVETNNIRCKWTQTSAEPEEQSDGRRRKMAGEWYVVLESIPALDTTQQVIKDDGSVYRIDRMEQAFSRVDLPYLVCRRADV
jgi:hypothetical protein